MDKGKALHKLLNGTATEQEIELLKQAVASGEISIGRDVNHSVVIIGSGNKIELTAEALSLIKPDASSPEQAAEGQPPYMGLRYFDTADCALFYGREKLTGELVGRLGSEPFLVIVGASGSGKSSIVRAGLIPAWKAASPGQVVVITPTAHPLESLAASLTRDSESVTATTTLMDDMHSDSRSLRLYILKRLSSMQETRFLLVIDQFEETFTLCKDPGERKAFIENLIALGNEEDSQVRLVVTLRADFYHHCAEYEGLRQALQTHQAYIGAMTSDELRQAIIAPAQANAWEFQPGLADLILQDVGNEPGALPLLSHALLETWKRREGRTLTLKGYADAGGVKKAIAQTAENVYGHFSPVEQNIAREIFLRLTELGEGVQDTRRRIKLDELSYATDTHDTVAKVLKILTDARLVTTEQDSAEVAHEALIREWGTLRRWLDEDRENIRLQRQLTESAREWDNAGRDESFLDHRGGRLEDALSLEKTSNYKITAIEQSYLSACVAYQQREQNRRERLRRQILYGLSAGFFIMLVIALLAGIQWQRAEQQTKIAFARQLAAQAKLLPTDNKTSLIQKNLLLIESIQRYSTLEAEQDLNNIFLYSPKWISRTSVSGLPDISQDGSVMATGDYQFYYIWDTTKGQVIAQVGHPSSYNSFSLTPDGKRIAAFDGIAMLVLDIATGQEISHFPIRGYGAYIAPGPGEGKAVTVEGSIVHLWDIATGQESARLPHTGSYVYTHMSTDGMKIATTDGKRVHIWDTTTGQEIALLLLSTTYSSVAFSQNGELLAGTDNRIVHIWDTATGQEIARLTHGNFVGKVQFNPDGTLLATASGKDIYLWDVGTGLEVGRMSHSTSISSFRFSPNGQLLASTESKAAHLWDVATAQEIARLAHATTYINSFEFSPDGRLFATSDNKTIHLWDQSTGLELSQLMLERKVSMFKFNADGSRLITSDGSLTTIWRLDSEWQPYNWESIQAVSPDRKLLVSASDCPPKETCKVSIRIWEASTKTDMYTFSLPLGPATAIAFSPNGESLAVSDSSGVVHMFDTTSWQETILDAGPSYIDGMAFSPDGKYLATGDGSKSLIRMWDLSSTKVFWTISDCRSVFSFSPDGTLLALVGWDNNIYIWDVGNNQPVRAILSEGGTTKLIFSPDGKFLLGNSSRLVRVWNIPDGQEIMHFVNDGIIWVFDIDPRGILLAAGGEDQAVRVWEVSSGKEKSRFLHDDTVTALAFNTDGTLLATGSSDKSARVWDIPSGQEVGRMMHDGEITLVSFDPDEDFIISSGNTSHIWPWSIANLINETCQRLPRNFTWAEWAYYFPDETYKTTCPNLPAEPEPTPTPTFVPTVTFVMSLSTTTAQATATYPMPRFTLTGSPTSLYPTSTYPPTSTLAIGNNDITSIVATAAAVEAHSIQTATALVKRNLARLTATALAEPHPPLTTTPAPAP